MISNLGVLELSPEKINDAAYKNTFIAQCQKEYLAICDSSKITKEKLLDLLEKEDILSYGDVFAFCAGEKQDAVQLPLENVLDCFAIQIVALVFRRDLLAESGNYNYRIKSMAEFEMLCRLTETYGNGIFVFPGISEDDLVLDREDAFVCAYIIRRYLQQLKTVGKMEDLLQQMCFAMEQYKMLACFKKELNQMVTNQEYYEHIACVTAPIFILGGDDTCYGVLQDFGCKVADVLRELGQAYILAEPGRFDYEYLVNHLCKAFVGFQTKAFKLDFFKKLHGPKIQFWFDNPVFYEEHFSDLPRDCYVLCHDKNYVTFIQQEYNRENARLLPPGGHMTEWNEEVERPYDIVFIGGYFPESDIPMNRMEKYFYQYMMEHPNATFATGLQATINELETECTKLPIGQLFTGMKPLCHKIINHYRTKVMETILEAGYQVHVYGDSWELYQSPYAHRLIRHQAVSVGESLGEWQKAKIGLNIMSWHKAGMTERIANIMLSGAVCLSEETAYLKEHFAEGEEIVTFNLNQLEELPHKIEQLLRNDTWRRIARNGYEIASREHTWEQRVYQLLKMMEEII